MLPNIEVIATAISGAEAQRTSKTVMVSAESRRLSVELTPSTENAGPGDEIELALEVNDAVAQMSYFFPCNRWLSAEDDDHKVRPHAQVPAETPEATQAPDAARTQRTAAATRSTGPASMRATTSSHSQTPMAWATSRLSRVANSNCPERL